MEGSSHLLHPLDSGTYTPRATKADDASDDASNDTADNRAEENHEFHAGAFWHRTLPAERFQPPTHLVWGTVAAGAPARYQRRVGFHERARATADSEASFPYRSRARGSRTDDSR